MWQQTCSQQLSDHGRHTAGAVIVFTQIFASGLQVDHQRHMMPDRLPVVIVQLYAQMPRNAV